MPAKNKKQLNFFLLVKGFKDGQDIGLKTAYKRLEGYKPRLTPEYIDKIKKAAWTIQDADLLNLTSGIESEAVLGDKKDLKVGYWALFRGKTRISPAETKENEYIGKITRVDNSKMIVNFNINDFRNKFGVRILPVKRVDISDNNFQYLDYSSFDNIIKTGKTPEEVAKKRELVSENWIRAEVKKAIQNILK